MKDKFSIPHLGDYTEILTKLGDFLDWDIIPPGVPSERVVEQGAKYCNELMCLPAKVSLGGFIEACQQGATKLLMFDSCGECRLKTYWILQARALNKLGYNATVYPVRLGRHTPGDIQRIDRALPLCKVWLGFIKMLHLINDFDKSHYPEIPDDRNLVKIGVVGEIYTMLEPGVNKRLVTKIQKMGAMVHISLPLSYFIFKGMYNRGWMKRCGIDQELYLTAQEKAHQYFPKEIGGHGNESIIHSIYYGLKGFDGIIHVLPFPCFIKGTNITTEGFLQKPIEEIKVGERILTHTGRFKRVSQTFCRDYSGSVLKLDCGGKLLTLSLTPEHPILLAKTFVKNHKKQISSFTFSPASEARTGNFVAIPIPIEICNGLSYSSDFLRRRRVPRHREMSNYLLVPIRKVESQDFTGSVYNLAVEEDNSYVANFIAAHNCMPESTVAPVVDDISHDFGIPIMRLIFDVQTGEAGLNTRLEAFVDILKRRKNISKR